MDAVISSAFIIEQKLRDFLALRDLLTEWSKEKDNFRLIHSTWSGKKYWVIKENDWDLLQRIKRGENHE